MSKLKIKARSQKKAGPTIELDETKRHDFGRLREIKGKVKQRFHEVLKSLGMSGKPAHEAFKDPKVKNTVLREVSECLKSLGSGAEKLFYETYGRNVTQWFSDQNPSQEVVIAKRAGYSDLDATYTDIESAKNELIVALGYFNEALKNRELQSQVYVELEEVTRNVEELIGDAEVLIGNFQDVYFARK